MMSSSNQKAVDSILELTSSADVFKPAAYFSSFEDLNTGNIESKIIEASARLNEAISYKMFFEAEIKKVSTFQIDYCRYFVSQVATNKEFIVKAYKFFDELNNNRTISYHDKVILDTIKIFMKFMNKMQKRVNNYDWKNQTDQYFEKLKHEASQAMESNSFQKVNSIADLHS